MGSTTTTTTVGVYMFFSTILAKMKGGKVVYEKPQWKERERDRESESGSISFSAATTTTTTVSEKVIHGKR